MGTRSTSGSPASGHEQLFGLDADPQELHDLARDGEATNRVTRWRETMVETLRARPEGFVANDTLVAAPAGETGAGRGAQLAPDREERVASLGQLPPDAPVR